MKSAIKKIVNIFKGKKKQKDKPSLFLNKFGNPAAPGDIETQGKQGA